MSFCQCRMTFDASLLVSSSRTAAGDFFEEVEVMRERTFDADSEGWRLPALMPPAGAIGRSVCEVRGPCRHASRYNEAQILDGSGRRRRVVTGGWRSEEVAVGRHACDCGALLARVVSHLLLRGKGSRRRRLGGQEMLSCYVECGRWGMCEGFIEEVQRRERERREREREREKREEREGRKTFLDVGDDLYA
ncbi:uncharacterized protein A4U43_C09F500 [Asparagus officinalis]|uniref:Uncharacterized protein n=1 Tax=Asparagus officinalis TaxID=4686 RepID=A0A5P1E912_ASPOF|nr:uncharacterized protein A4U43_C09F500 [Asparagus officinalis]